MTLPRRAFLGGVSSAVVLALWPKTAEAKKAAIPLDAAPPLKKVGGYTILEVKKTKILFIRDTEKTVLAVDPICTHKKNLLFYNAEAGVIECEEHGSQYAKDGKVLEGPSERPLTKFYRTKLDLEGQRILILL